MEALDIRNRENVFQWVVASVALVAWNGEDARRFRY